MNSTLKADLLTPFISSEYSLPEPVQCEFVRRGFNDHYLVRSRTKRYFLRVYLNGKYYIGDSDDFRFELELLEFLASHGLRVVRPVPNRAHEHLSTIEAPDGKRHMALFEFVDGDPIVGSAAECNAGKLGEMVVTIHTTADAFRAKHSRYDLDLHYLLDEPLRLLEDQLLSRGMGDLSYFRPAADRIRRTVEKLGKVPGAYGIIHGDLIPSNILYSDLGITVIDFDYAGYGWRAYDIETLASCYGESTAGAIKRGYESVRPLSDLEEELLPTFNTLRWKLWDVGDILAMMPVWGETPDEDYLRKASQTFRSLASVG